MGGLADLGAVVRPPDESLGVVEAVLQRLALEVAQAIGEGNADVVRFSYRCTDGDWGWECRVEEKRVRHGRGHRVVRSEFTTYGATPKEAAAEALRKAGIPGFLEL